MNPAARSMRFSLFYFADDSLQRDPTGRYSLLLEGARFADRHGFDAVWTPERHFHAFGGLYPNPSVTGAAVAAITERVAIRAGSVVLPLHDPIRVAEEWAVVDNLSGGRVGISFASGWHAVDFVLAHDRFASRKALMAAGIATVQALWRGERVVRTDGLGNQVEVRIFPPPVQPELPVWVTSSGNVETFRLAGQMGANLLTHLLGQRLADLGENIAEYRRCLAASSGGTRAGHVTLMLHTFLGDDLETVRETVRDPFSAYLRSSLGLIARSATTVGEEFDPARLTDAEVGFLVARAFDRYFETSGLFGTVDTAIGMIERLHVVGVDEVACLIDFGVSFEAAMAGLERLDTLRRLVTNAPARHASL